MPDPNNYVIFPSGMPEKATIAANDKMMFSDSESSSIPVWKSFTELLNNLAITLAKNDSSNLTEGNKTSWKAALNIAFETETLFDGTGTDVETISTNGYYATDATTTNIPADNRVGVLLVLNYDSGKKFLTYRTIIDDLPKIYYRIYDGSSWSAWIAVETIDISPYLKIDGSNLSTDSGEKDTWKTWLETFLSDIELGDILLTGLEIAYTPSEKQTWWGLSVKSIKQYLQNLVDKSYNNYVNIQSITGSYSTFEDGMYWNLNLYSDRGLINESQRYIGAAVTYEVATGYWLTERFTGPDVTNTNWNNDNNWETILDSRREEKGKVYTVPNNDTYDLLVGDKTKNVQIKVEYSAERGTEVQVGEIRYIVTNTTVKFYPSKFETITGLTLTKYENGDNIYLRINLSDNINDCKFEYSINRNLKN